MGEVGAMSANSARFRATGSRAANARLAGAEANDSSRLSRR